jgi:hypothetical protein
MKHFLIAKATLSVAALALLFCALGGRPAYATTVDYYTEACIGTTACGTSTFSSFPSYTSGGLDLSFVGAGTSTVPDSVNASPMTNISLGDVNVTSDSTGATLSTLPFDIEIFQTSPTGGQGTLDGSVTGTITYDSSTAYVTFTNNTVSIDGETYALTYNPVAIVPTSTNLGTTSIQGTVSSVPEPMSYVLLGSGLLGIGLMRKRAERMRLP